MKTLELLQEVKDISIDINLRSHILYNSIYNSYRLDKQKLNFICKKLEEARNALTELEVACK